MSSSPTVSPLEQIQVERLAPDRYRLAFPATPATDVEIHSSLSADAAAGSCAVTPVSAERIDIGPLPSASRHYFHVHVDGSHQGTLAERHVPLEGTPNFRDFGGYATRDGRFVRWGQLYRSGMLNTLTAADLAVFESLGIGLVCDFRHGDERDREPSRLPQDRAPRLESLPLEPGNLVATLKGLFRGAADGLSAADTVAAMCAINREFVVEHAAIYQRLLELLLETDAPLLIHCAAGKDRTGFGAAVILAALGVPEATIMRDYLLSRRYFRVENEVDGLARRYGLALPRDLLEPMIEVRPEYLQAALDRIREEFGSFDNYLEAGLGLTPEARRELQARLLI